MASKPQPKRLLFAVLALGLVLVIMGPLLAGAIPALQDYPNHLARTFILLHPDDPLLRENYRTAWNFYPNLGWDLWTLAAAHIMPVSWAGISNVLGCFLLTIAGVCTFHYALTGRWTPVPVFATPLLFSIGFTKGFQSFNLGLALALFAAAWWIAMPERRWLLRLTVATILSSVLYLMHFAAWALYGVIVLGLHLHDIAGQPSWIKKRRRLLYMLRDGVQALPPAAMAIELILSSHPSPGASSAISGIEWPFIRFGELSWLLDAGDPALSVFLAVIFGLVLASVWALGFVRMDRRMTIPLGLMTLLFFFVPNHMGDTYYAATRIGVGCFMFGIPSFAPTALWDAARIRRYLLVVLVVSVGAGVARLPLWIDTYRGVMNFRSIIAPLPPGSKLFWAHTQIRPSRLIANASGLYHVASYGVIERRLLVQSMFVYTGQQPLRFADSAYQNVKANSDTFLKQILTDLCRSGVTFRDHVATFDFVLLHGAPDTIERRVFPTPEFAPVSELGAYRLYRRLPVPAPALTAKAHNRCIRYGARHG